MESEFYRKESETVQLIVDTTVFIRSAEWIVAIFMRKLCVFIQEMD